MKKILMVVILLSALTACAKSENVAVTKTDVPQSTTIKKDFELVFSSFRQGNVVVYYPQIQGFYNAERQDKLNETILKEAKKVTTLFGDDIVCITVDYEIVKRSDELIIVEYTGYGCTSAECENEETVTYTSTVRLTDK